MTKSRWCPGPVSGCVPKRQAGLREVRCARKAAQAGPHSRNIHRSVAAPAQHAASWMHTMIGHKRDSGSHETSTGQKPRDMSSLVSAKSEQACAGRAKTELLHALTATPHLDASWEQRQAGVGVPSASSLHTEGNKPKATSSLSEAADAACRHEVLGTETTRTLCLRGTGDDRGYLRT